MLLTPTVNGILRICTELGGNARPILSTTRTLARPSTTPFPETWYTTIEQHEEVPWIPTA